MPRTTLPLLILVATACKSNDGEAAATRLKQSIDAIELCMHWPGEEPYDIKRGEQISEGIQRDCPTAVAAAKANYAAVATSPEGALALVQLVAHFESDFGADRIVPPSGKPNLCAAAKREVQRRKQADATDDYFPYFDQFCGKLD